MAVQVCFNLNLTLAQHPHDAGTPQIKNKHPNKKTIKVEDSAGALCL
jgi:hypothetical protein